MFKVYHIRDKVDNNDLLVGYVGITSRTLKERWKEHLEANSKVGFYIRELKLSFKNMVQIYSGTEEECFNLENALRPKINMGWNVAEGGKINSFSTIPFMNKTKLKSKPTKVNNRGNYTLQGWSGKSDGIWVKNEYSIVRTLSKTDKTKKGNPVKLYHLEFKNRRLTQPERRAHKCVEFYEKNRIKG